MKKVFVILLALICSIGCFGQKKVKLKQANTLRGSIKDGVRVDWVIGDVIFIQNTTTIYCDSAIFYKSKNSVEAYGKIRITEGDSVTVTASSLTYDGDRKIAYLRRNVVFNKLETASLYTDFLDYDRVKNEARYFNKGKLVDTTNTLTSTKGYYDLNTNMASFKTNVVALNKDYTMTSDTLQYNSGNKFVYFRAHTVVIDKEQGEAVYENGYYDTRNKKSDLVKGEFQTPSYKLIGAKLLLDDILKLYKVIGDVVMTSKAENMHIYGDKAIYNRGTGVSKVYGHAYVARVMEENDTLFISADTLMAVENEDPKKKRLLAYRNVRIYKNDFQARADSMVYSSSDSVLLFYKDPVLWSDENQMTADTIKIYLEDKKISRIYMQSKSFVASTDTLKNFNQIKGRKMTAFFKGKNIDHVVVEGNGESLYFALQVKEEEKEGKKEKFTIVSGMNKIQCSNMKINFLDGKVNNISFYVKPDASFTPPHELKEEATILKGFKWRGADRPTRSQVVQVGK